MVSRSGRPTKMQEPNSPFVQSKQDRGDVTGPGVNKKYEEKNNVFSFSLNIIFKTVKNVDFFLGGGGKDFKEWDPVM